ncbi:hypothetical protein T492DRAFT_835570 [Pavlovales sp. CCMP2436]|nr:hypothetical protein T492DRAFT_835570 [Pavlovales sp. CCMP2436]
MHTNARAHTRRFNVHGSGTFTCSKKELVLPTMLPLIMTSVPHCRQSTSSASDGTTPGRCPPGPDLNVSTRTHRESLHGRRQARESDAINRDHPESYDGKEREKKGNKKRSIFVTFRSITTYCDSLPALVFPPSFVLVVTLQTNSGISSCLLLLLQCRALAWRRLNLGYGCNMNPLSYRNYLNVGSARPPPLCY